MSNKFENSDDSNIHASDFIYAMAPSRKESEHGAPSQSEGLQHSGIVLRSNDPRQSGDEKGGATLLENQRPVMSDIREFSFTVDEEDAGHGIRRIMKKHLALSARVMAKMNAQKLVWLNGKKYTGKMKIHPGDTVTVHLPDEVSHFPEDDVPILPVYEDQDLMVINKPAGYTVHPTKGHPDHTIANGVMKYMREHGQSYKIRFVNRLDMDTSGLLIIGKNSHTQDVMSKDMKTDRVEKRYMAIVNGVLDKDDFVIDLPIGGPVDDTPVRTVKTDGTGKDCVTVVHVLKRLENFTAVEITLKTGRTHQIRVHMSYIGHPLVGDPLYGGGHEDLIGRQALHSWKLAFHHPVTDELIKVEAPLPEDMEKLIAAIS
ncbi:MAG: RluA family pseudouridine synthase [Eubacteriales bacterium]|nr:RluA family pseudouridine synthase [Eubacteriales bacterium]